MEGLTHKTNGGRLALAAICALAAVFALPALLNWERGLTHSAVMLALFALLWLMGARLLCWGDRRLKRFSLAFGFAFGLCQLAGARLDAAGTVGGGLAPLLLPVAALALAPALGCCFGASARLLERNGSRGGADVRDGREHLAAQCGDPVDAGKAAAHPTGFRRVFWASFGVILLCWLPVYLAYFPGMFNYDSTGEAAQFTTGVYNGAFPPVHTLLLGAFYGLGQALGSPNAGIALYTAIQAGTLAAAMAYAAAYLYELGCSRTVRVAMVGAFALLPFHSMLAMCTTKDLFFSAALLMLMIKLHMGWHNPEQWRSKGQLAWVALMAAALGLFRPNGVAAIALLVIVGFCMLRGHADRRRFMAAALGGLALFAVVNGGLTLALKPSKTGIREMFSVPLAQVARVRALSVQAGETLPQEEEILAFIPDADRYQPHLSDGIKRHTTLGVVNMPAFLRLWAELGLREPAAYVDAFLYLTKGYWHLDDLSHAEIYAERGQHGYLETANQDGFGVTRASLLPSLMNALDELFVDNRYQEIPILSVLVEPALWCWLLWAVMWAALYLRRRDALFCSAMLAGLYLTMLLGPCAYMRYAYPLALCTLPLCGICLSRPTSDEVKP